MGLYRPATVAELDRRTIEEFGVPGYTLMCRAGARVFQVIRALWPQARAITVLCGGGNNGGDGYVVARLAHEAGLAVQVIALVEPSRLKGDARRAADDWLALDGGLEQPSARMRGDVIVDALLGTGLDRPVEGEFRAMIERLAGRHRPVVAVDVPSGLSADTGEVMGAAVKARVTVSFIGRKRGLYTGQGPLMCGKRQFFDLDVPEQVYRQPPPDAWLLDRIWLESVLPPRPATTHKGDLGHVAVVGGDRGMAGAPALAGRAALLAGSGLVTVGTRAEHVTLPTVIQPELMSHAVEDDEDLARILDLAGVVALGPGLGQSEWSKVVWERVITVDVPLIIDADGLNLLSCRRRPARDWILTPHPGEAARLLEIDTATVQADRFSAARQIAERFGAVCVLKGAGTVIAEPAGLVAVCAAGNPAMASAGMGDALTGIIASLRGQGLESFDAACAGVFLHALAGDRAAAGRRQILASELIDALAVVLPA